MIKSCVLVFAIAACGGGAKSQPMEPTGVAVPPASDCQITARAMTEAVFKWKEPPPTSQDNVFSVLRSHCDDDKWSMEAQECFRKVTDEASSAPCAEKLTKEQQDKVMTAMMAMFEPKQDGASPASAPPPGSPAPAKGADPCDGGE